ncbi:MAG: hypothetical protein ACON3Z_11775 [Bradymonadia bacterium]
MFRPLLKSALLLCWCVCGCDNASPSDGGGMTVVVVDEDGGTDTGSDAGMNPEIQDMSIGASTDMGRDTGMAVGGTDVGVLSEWMPPPPINRYSFAAFEEWAAPIEDVLTAGQLAFGADFSRSISDLMAFEGRMWVGYGDANVNLGGVVPITFRYFESADTIEASLGLVSGEEQIDRFRVLDDTLWMPGVDSLGSDEQRHFPAVGGNMYTYGDGAWRKHPTVPGGEHVHDVAAWGGVAWAVGSGADDRPEFEAGQIHRYLWRSLDQGRSWMTIHREPFPTPGSGDTRWVSLLPQQDNLYLFGYEFNWEENQTQVLNARFDGWEVHRLQSNEPLNSIFAVGTLPIALDTSLLWGVDVNVRPLANQAWVVMSGLPTTIPYLTGRTVIDVYRRADTEELLILSRQGDAYGEMPESFELKIHLASAMAPNIADELMAWTATSAPTAVGFFDGSLFLGTADGKVFKALGSTSDNP